MTVGPKLRLATIFLGGMAASEADAQDPAPSLGWLTGCWEFRRGTLVIEEHGMPPRRGDLLGVSRTMRGDSVVSHEFPRIYRAPDGYVLAAAPSSQAPAEFRLAKWSAGMAEFRNLQHDFPQHIRYSAVGTESLIAEIEGDRGGEMRRVRFPFGRVDCIVGAEVGPDHHQAEIR